jgi:hypothetical protein
VCIIQVETIKSADSISWLGTLVTFAAIPEILAQAQPLEKLAIEYKVDAEGSTTALYDGLATALTSEKSRTDRVICTVVPDGAENSSQYTDRDQIQSMIRARRELGNWTFIWLSLDGKPSKTASRLGIDCITARREDIAQALSGIATQIVRATARLAGGGALRRIEKRGDQ